MTTSNAAAGNGHAGPSRYAAPRYLRCLHCGMPQPVASVGPSRCVSCGAPLQRWVAHPPPVAGPARTNRTVATPRSSLPYLGPPSYRGGHPRWSFPPVVWKELPEPPVEQPRSPVPALRRAAWLAVVTAVAAAGAAGAEIWRFVLMLRGRTEVLSGTAVLSSDVLVAAMGLAVVVAALATAVVAVPALIRAHRLAAHRAGRAPSRSPAAVAVRLLVPVWNVYGAGQIAVEIDRMLLSGLPAEERDQRTSRVTPLWWSAWVVSSVLVCVTLARGLGDSLQAIADTVELHIALDFVAVVVAVLTALMFRRFATLLAGRRNPLSGWVVRPPAPTRPLPAATRSAATAEPDGTPAATRSAAPAEPTAKPAAPAEPTAKPAAPAEPAAKPAATAEPAAIPAATAEPDGTPAATRSAAPAAVTHEPAEPTGGDPER